MSSLSNFLNDHIHRTQSQTKYNNELALVLGLMDKTSHETKFGYIESAGATKTDVWGYGGTQPLYIFPDAGGETATIVSTEAGDNQIIAIDGISDSGAATRVEVTLDGDNPVTVPGSWLAFNRKFNNDSSPFIGVVTIQGDGSTSTNVFSHMTAEDQQTAQSIYMVPGDKVAAITNISSAINKSGGADMDCLFTFAVQKPGKVFRNKIIYGLQKTGTSAVPFDLPIPLLLGPLSKAKISGTPSASNTSMSNLFAMKLIDADIVPTAILEGLS